jgi:hypothetical protein
LKTLASIGFRGDLPIAYDIFYERINELTLSDPFKDYIIEIEGDVRQKLELIEKQLEQRLYLRQYWRIPFI